MKNFNDAAFVDKFEQPGKPFYFIPREKLVELKKKMKLFNEKQKRLDKSNSKSLLKLTSMVKPEELQEKARRGGLIVSAKRRST